MAIRIAFSWEQYRYINVDAYRDIRILLNGDQWPEIIARYVFTVRQSSVAKLSII